MNEFEDLFGRLIRLKKQAIAIHGIAEQFQYLGSTGPKQIEVLRDMTAGIIDDLNKPATEPLPPKKRPIGR